MILNHSLLQVSFVSLLVIIIKGYLDEDCEKLFTVNPLIPSISGLTEGRYWGDDCTAIQHVASSFIRSLSHSLEPGKG